jgi:sortase A
MMRRTLRALGTVFVLAGICCLVWAALVWQWQDPFTALYTKLQQNRLTVGYNRLLSEYERGGDRTLAMGDGALARTALEFGSRVRRGDAIGRLRIESVGLDVLLVNGTDRESLKRGPGRYTGRRVDVDGFIGTPPQAYFPGEGQLVYVAGHRTTFGAPFSRIDRIGKGDRVVLEMPYATFEYRVTGHRIVPSSSVEILRSKGHEQLALQACHPRFMATHRYVVYAEPVRVTPRGATATAVAAAGQTSDR